MDGGTLKDNESMDISKLKVPDLRRELKAKGLSTSGNKNDLMERLLKAMKTKIDDAVGTECVDDLEEDLLNDDDDEHLDGSESGITDLDSAIDVPALQKSHKRKSSETSQEDQPKPVKKVVLNRKPSNSDDLMQNDLDEETKTEPNADIKKVIKLSELSAKERLEMRAKKFGVALPADAKKAVRAERFGTSNVTTTKLAVSTATLNVDLLKQRAQRFGTSVSSVMTKLNNEERLEKRKERFGLMTSTNGSSQTDKAKQRLERFKMPVK